VKRGDLVTVSFSFGEQPDEVAVYLRRDESVQTNDPAYMRVWVFWAGQRTSFPVQQIKVISEAKSD